MKNKIYIAGPMSGHPCFNFEAFFVAAMRLKKCGFNVINPAEVDTLKMFGGWTYSKDQYPDILFNDLKLIKEEAGCLFMLDGWTASPGATAEFTFASAIGVGTVTESEIITACKLSPQSQYVLIMKEIINAKLNIQR